MRAASLAALVLLPRERNVWSSALESDPASPPSPAACEVRVSSSTWHRKKQQVAKASAAGTARLGGPVKGAGKHAVRAVKVLATHSQLLVEESGNRA